MIPKKDVLYTYEDYLKWDTADIYELIEGIPYLLATPSREHQKISMNLSTDFNNYFRGKGCEVYAAPFEVVLVKDDKVDNKSRTVQVFKLVNGQYNETDIYMENEEIQVNHFPWLSIDLKRIF